MDKWQSRRSKASNSFTRVSNKMKLALLILFLIVALAVNEVYSKAFKDSKLSDPRGNSRGSNDPWGNSRGPTDYRCGPSYGRKRRGIDKKYKEQTFYQYDKSSNRCVSYKSSSMTPGSTGFKTQSECEYTCVQRRG